MNLGLLALTLPMTAGAPPAMIEAPVPACPFLFVTVNLPGGGRTVWYPGTPQAIKIADKGVIGLRPGYAYRLELTDLPEQFAGLSLYPTIEVQGSLQYRPGMKMAQHPVPIHLSREEIARIRLGRLVTKVYYLEDPDQAPAVGSGTTQTLESLARGETEAIDYARAKGRPVLIFRVGERSFTPEELQTENVPGTVLLPGTPFIPTPAAPPYVAYAGIALYDPIIGPRWSTFECFHDGGDGKRPLGIGMGGSLFGLDASDTAMEFTVREGRQVVASNRVCICVPRFAAATVEQTVEGNKTLGKPQYTELYRTENVFLAKIPPGTMKQFEQAIGLLGRQRTSGLESELGLLIKSKWMRPEGLSHINGTKVVAEVRAPADLTMTPCKLLLTKSIDPNPEKIGDVVTVTLRFVNATSQTMTDVLISDSLSPRLEYIEKTAKSSKGATFTVVPNESGSARLQWAIDGSLLPGEGGVISFKVRIR